MDLIQSGEIIKRENNDEKVVAYEMLFLDKSHLNEVLALQSQVVASIGEDSLFVPDSKKFILEEVLAEGRGKMIGIFTEDGLVAYRSISFPGAGKYNMGKEIGIPSDELDKVAHLESTVVDPSYRGNRLQVKMLKPTLEYIRTNGYYHILTTISPNNYPSLSNIIKAEFRIRDLKKRNGVYGGRWRFLLARDLREPALFLSPMASIKNKDIQGHQRLLKKGFMGYALKKGDRNFEILYGKSI